MRLALFAAAAGCAALLAGCGQNPNSTNPAFTPVAPVNPCGNSTCGASTPTVSYPPTTGSSGKAGSSGTSGSTGTNGKGTSGTTGSSGSGS